MKQPKQRKDSKKTQGNSDVQYPLFPDCKGREIRALRVSEFLDDDSGRCEAFKETAEPTATVEGLFNFYASPEQRDIHFLVEALDIDGNEIKRTEVKFHSEIPPTGIGPAYARTTGQSTLTVANGPVVLERDQVALPASATVAEARMMARETSMLGHLESTGRTLTSQIAHSNSEITRTYLAILKELYGDETPRVKELRKIVEDQRDHIQDLKKHLDDAAFRIRSNQHLYDKSVMDLDKQAYNARVESQKAIVALERRVMELEIELLRAKGDAEKIKEENRQREGVIQSLLTDGALQLAPAILQRLSQAFGAPKT